MNAAESHVQKSAAHHHDRVVHWQWLIVVGLGVLALVLGTIGFGHGIGADGQPEGVVDAFYDSMRLFHMHFERAPYPLPWELQIARFLAPLVLGFTLVKGFLFVAHSHRRAFQHGSMSDHIVICGLGQKGLQLAKEYRDKKESVVVIEKDPSNELLTACDDAGIFYWIGDATDAAVLEHACVAAAKAVVVITPEDETNVRIALQIRRLAAHMNSKRPECFVHLENIHLRERLQELPGKDPAKQTGVLLNFFDVYDGEARRVLLELPLDGTGIAKDDPRSVHVVILGFGRMGRSVALRAAKMGHFANGKLLRISVIDHIAEQQREHFLFHHPVLEMDPGKEVICQLQFHQAEAQSLQARKLIAGWAAEPHTLLHLFVCMDDNARAVEVGLRLQEMLARRPDCNLRVRIKTSASLAHIFDLPAEMAPRIVAFGMVEDACSDQTVRHEFNEAVARALHLGYRKDLEHRRAAGETIPKKPAEVPWEELVEEYRESNRQAADHIPIKARALGYHIGELKTEADPIRTLNREQKRILAPMEHARWCAERWLAGWKHADVRDDDHHRHPDLVPWKNLTDTERRIDHAQIEQLADALAAKGQEIFK